MTECALPECAKHVTVRDNGAPYLCFEHQGYDRGQGTIICNLCGRPQSEHSSGFPEHEAETREIRDISNPRRTRRGHKKR